ncbi:regulation of nuclear pre-mRNA domain-containing protein 1B [Galendromus occidentalis]|uniref:Regulation of nuclear pre-mRNA domain-containing protein 1B n=1 Tax=Galendromus occidentalis TaxID=34638 RepID=A0AAJ6QR42_9ACAR|nr:regulation of nuclear pre-mRNA domain-containing protein 1B [Galendromus occidentalis]
MSTFSEESLVKRLKELSPTQQGIETLSLWLIHHRKHHKRIAEVWLKVLLELEKASRKLNLLYLANDVIQNSRRKGLDFPTSFIDPLNAAFHHIFGNHPTESKVLAAIERTISIWKQRKIYDDSVLSSFEKHARKIKHDPSDEKHPKKIGDSTFPQQSGITPSPSKKARPNSPFSENMDLLEKINEFQKHKVEYDSEPTSDSKVPDHAEVIRAILALENAPSADAAIREKIASLPPEVRDVAMLEKIQDQATLNKLRTQVDEACELLKNYNGDLDKEISDRGKLANLLHDFRKYNSAKIMDLVKELDTYKQKLQTAVQVRDEVRRHANKLPDMTKLPNVTQGRLVPLPTAGDLFTK